MTKKGRDNKLGGVKSTTLTTGVLGPDSIHSTESVSGVKSVAPASSVGGVQGAASIGKRRPTRAMTIEERQQLLAAINEEAEKMFSSGVLPASKKDVITQAVKMAVNAGLIEDQEDEEKK